MSTIGTITALDGNRGAVRVEEVYDTDIADLWRACTEPERLARWIAHVTGEPRLGASVHVVFTSTWAGETRIDVCDAPHHLLVTGEPGTPDESQIEAWLTTEGTRTRLVVEERGLPVGKLHFFGAGWQTHLEDLATALAGDGPVHPDGWSDQRPAAAWRDRWTELSSAYQDEAVLG